jgi:uncharacterized protein (DUF2147 family)
MELGERWMIRSALPLAAVALSTMLLASGAAHAADPVGLWLSQDGDVKMKVSHCGSGICGTIAWLKHPNDENGKPKLDKNNADAGKRNRPVIGTAVILPMQAESPDKWSGQVYNAEDGKTYSGSFTLAGANKADLKGCVAIICKSKSWTRTN